MADLKKSISQIKQVRITEERIGYVHAEYITAIWRFMDDVKFFFNEYAHVIQTWSTLLLGKSDFGVNRKRIVIMRALWKTRGK